MTQPPATGPDAPPHASAAIAFAERHARALVAGLLAALLLQGVLFITESSQTSDEAAHLSAGYSYLTTGDFRLNKEHPPLIKELAALPLLPLRLEGPRGLLWEQAEEWNIGRIFVHENRVPNDTILFLARMPILLLSLLLGWTMYRWGRRLFGVAPALLALSLYVLDPNIVAHSGLVTTDLGVTLFIFLSIDAFWCWSERPDRRTLMMMGAAVGGAFAAKYTAVWLPPILAALGASILLLGAPLPANPLAPVAKDTPRPVSLLRRIARLLLAAVIVIGIAFGVLAVSYGVSQLPVYLDGLRITLRHSEEGHRAYLMGATSTTGWWYYFPLAWLIKTPPGTLLLALAALVAWLRGARLRLKDELFIGLPIVITLAITSVFKVNIGLRHILPIYPFLFLWIGRVLLARRSGVGAASERPRPAAAAAVVLAAAGLSWNVVEAARITPYHLAYFNPMVGGPERGHLYLLDSNLDWGQAAKALQRFVAAEKVPMIYCAFGGNTDPWYYGVRYQYVPGSGNLLVSKERPARMPPGAPRELFAISAMVLHSVHFSDPGLYDWLLDRKPVAMPGYAFLIFDITGQADSHATIAALCLSFRLSDLAGDEARRALQIDPANSLAQAVLQKIEQEARAAPNAVQAITRTGS